MEKILWGSSFENTITSWWKIQGHITSVGSTASWLCEGLTRPIMGKFGNEAVC